MRMIHEQDSTGFESFDNSNPETTSQGQRKSRGSPAPNTLDSTMGVPGQDEAHHVDNRNSPHIEDLSNGTDNFFSTPFDMPFEGEDPDFESIFTDFPSHNQNASITQSKNTKNAVPQEIPQVPEEEDPPSPISNTPTTQDIETSGTATSVDTFKDDRVNNPYPLSTSTPDTAFTEVEIDPQPRGTQRIHSNPTITAATLPSGAQTAKSQWLHPQYYSVADIQQGGMSLPVLRTPSAPILVGATLTSLTIEWEPVDNASGYYVDFFCVSRLGETPEAEAMASERLREHLDQTSGLPDKVPVTNLDATKAAGPTTSVDTVTPEDIGNTTNTTHVPNARGHRLTREGNPLIRETHTTIHGLQPNALYMVRIVAVGTIVLTVPQNEDTTTPPTASMAHSVPIELVSHYESTPSPLSLPMRTLHPEAEVARLTRYVAEMERSLLHVPVLEDKLASMQEDVTRYREELNAAREENARLAKLVTEREDALDGANRRVNDLEASIVRETDANLQLTGTLSKVENELTMIKGKNASLVNRLETKEKECTALQGRLNKQENKLAKQEGTITALRQRVKSIQADLRLKDSVRLELLEKLKSVQGNATDTASEKDVIIGKLTDDLAKVIGELDVTQRNLQAAEDELAQLQPLVKSITEIRRQQKEWDEQYATIQAGGPLARLGAARKLGPRPTLTL